MIPFAPGFFKPRSSGLWSDSFSVLPSLTNPAPGEAQSGTPVIDSGALKFGARYSGSTATYSWWAKFDGSPTVEDFDLTFYIKVYNPDYGLGWYSGCAVAYRCSEAPPSGENLGYPNDNTGKAMILRFEPASSGNVRTQFAQYADGVVATTSYDANVPHNTLTKIRLLVSGNNHKLYVEDVLETDFTQSAPYDTATYRPASQFYIGAYTNRMFSGIYGHWIDDLAMIY
jgi:hypothetical protein